jgi:hypothetical protein
VAGGEIKHAAVFSLHQTGTVPEGVDFTKLPIVAGYVLPKI